MAYKKDSREHLQAVVNDECGIKLTDAQADEVMQDPHVGSEIREWGIMDTETRSAISNFLSQKITGRHWPMYRDSKEERESFWTELREKGRKMGYEVSEVEE